MMKILFVSLGCDKNLVDTECMIGMLQEQGYQFTNEEADADIIIVNSCCFINDAKEESIQTILELAELKKTAHLKVLIVTGCLAQRYQHEIVQEIPEVDAILGTSAYDQIVEALQDALKGTKSERFDNLDKLPTAKTKRILTTPGHYAHLKIAEGCNKNCTYCIIPSIRGHYRSVPIEELVDQAKTLAANGVKELILVAQETTLYGTDLYGKKSLHTLLEKLNEIQGVVWIRIMYCYPEEIYPELIQAIKKLDKVCHYLDMPIQHADNELLKRMNRRTNQEELNNRIQDLREQIPDICLRTTLISGFPGETQKAHDELMTFVKEMKFDRLGVFAFSPEEGTKAFEMSDQVPDELKEEWRDEVMELSEQVIMEKNRQMIDQEMLAIVDGKLADENTYIARTYRDAPDIDGYLFITTDQLLMTGDVVKARITGAYEYDLIGEIV